MPNLASVILLTCALFPGVFIAGYCTESNTVVALTGRAPLWRDPMRLYRQLNVRVKYLSWQLADIHPAPNGAVGFDSKIDYQKGKQLVQLGRTGLDARWFHPVSIHLRAAMHDVAGTHADAELIVINELDNSHHRVHKTVSLPTHIATLVMVFPLTCVSANASKPSSELAKALSLASGKQPDEQQRANLTVDLSPLLAEVNKNHVLLDIHRFAYQPLVYCDNAIVIIMSEPLPIDWTWFKGFNRPLGAKPVSEPDCNVLEADLKASLFPRLREYPSSPLDKPLLWMCLSVLIGGLAYLSTVIIVYIKNYRLKRVQDVGSLTERMLSRTVRLNSLAKTKSKCGDDESNTSSSESENDAAEECECIDGDRIDKVAWSLLGGKSLSMVDVASQTQNKTLAALCHLVYILLCIFIGVENEVNRTVDQSYVGNVASDRQVTCYEHMPWSGHFQVFLVFILFRITDLYIYSKLPLAYREIELCQPLVRSVTTRFLVSAVFFSNVWFEVVTILVVQACGSVLWRWMLGTFILVRVCLHWLILPVVCFWMDSPKCIYKICHMDMTAYCIQHKGREEKLYNTIFWMRSVLLNFPMGCMQLCFFCTTEKDSLILIAILLSFVSGAMALCQVCCQELQITVSEYEKITLRRKLERAEDIGDEEAKIRLLTKASKCMCDESAEIMYFQSTVQEDIFGVHKSKDELIELLGDYCVGHFRSTSIACLDVLASGEGGLVIVVLHDELKRLLRCQTCDEGALLNVFQAASLNVREEPDDEDSCEPAQSFKRILEIMSSVNHESDRWLENQVDEMQELLPGCEKECQALKCQPRDGAMVIDYNGNILNAAALLGHRQARWRLVKSKGEGQLATGSRHAAALNTIVWLNNQRLHGLVKNWKGVVFVRSDDGGLHCMFGFDEDKGRPKVYCIPQDQSQSPGASKLSDATWAPTYPQSVPPTVTPVYRQSITGTAAPSYGNVVFTPRRTPFPLKFHIQA